MLPVATPRELEALRVGAAGSPVPPGPLAAASVPGPQRGRTRSTSVTAQDCGRWRMTRGPRLVAQASLLHSRAPGRGRRGRRGRGRPARLPRRCAPLFVGKLRLRGCPRRS